MPIKDMDYRDNEPIWYLLFEGQSEDGRGTPNYVGREKNTAAVLSWYRKHIKPHKQYNTGYIMVVDNHCEHRLTESESSEQWLKLQIAKEQKAIRENLTPDHPDYKAPRTRNAKHMGKAPIADKPDNYGAFA